jgi:hypothetical protein
MEVLWCTSFSDSLGSVVVEFCLDAGSDAGSSLVLHKSHYLGFGAAGALLHHLKHDLRLALAPKSFQVG